MRKLLFGGVAGLLALGGAGCQSFMSSEPHATLGYHAGFYKQSVVVGSPPVTPVLNTSSAALVGIDHQASMSAFAGPAAQGVEAGPVLDGSVRYRSFGRSRSVAALAPADSCSVDDLCARMARMEIMLKQCLPQQPPAAQKMPAGQE